MEDLNIPYKPLNLSRKDIRLFRIDIATEEELRVSTCVVSLPDKPRYECISYICGPQNPKVSILVDGQSMDITVNLATVLRYFGAESEKTWLWADAICINQTDNMEKSHQVQFMSEIFAAASQVRAWIKPMNSLSPEANNLDREEVRVSEEVCRTALQYFYAARDDNPSIAEILHPGLSDMASALFNLFSDPFWQRMWITQELLLNDNTKIYYGSVQFMFFGRLKFTALYDSVSKCRLAFARLAGRDDTDTHATDETLERVATLLTTVSKHLWEAGQIFSRLSLSELLYQERAWERTTQLPPEPGRTLASLYSYNFRIPQGKVYAEREHDYVYAMLGLVPNEVKIEVDYNIAYQEVYADFTFKNIKWLKNLTPVLVAMWHHDGLPSWVIDYSQVGNNMGHGLARNAPFFSADEGVPFSVEKSHDILFVQGIMPDTIQHVSQSFSPSDADPISFFSAASDFYRSARASAGMNPLMVALSVELVRTILVDTQLTQHTLGAYAAGRSLESIKKMHKRLTADEVSQWTQAFSGRVQDMSHDTCRAMSSVASHMHSKRLFLTKGGRLGLADGKVESGDEICVFGRCPMPLAVRSQAERNGYELISALYVDEMMDGQALEICIDQVLNEGGTSPARRLAII